MGAPRKVPDSCIGVVIGMYANRVPAARIGALFGVTRSPILRILREQGIPIRDSHAARLPLRHDAFDVLTPDAAYWIGFLFADGCVSHRRGELTPIVSVGVSEVDHGHVVALRAFLGSTHTIRITPGREYWGKTQRPTCRYEVTSGRLADRLLSLGRYAGPIHPALIKSRDFWRGVTDGDGWIGLCHRPQPYAVFGIVGETRLLDAFNAFLATSGVADPITVRPHKSIYVVETVGSRAQKIIDVLYSGATTVLARKAHKARIVLETVRTTLGATPP